MRQIIFSALLLLFFWGCAQRGYTTAQINEVSYPRYGRVIAARAVKVHDTGEGTILGAIIGAIIGHQFGGGSGNDIATAAGAIAGGVIGSRLNEANAQELIIRLDNGEEIATVVRVDYAKGFWFRRGDRVRIFLKRNRIVKIEPVFGE
ncbi:outer membrane lipoprotein SlyB [Nitratiruptor sp. YY08-26]|uniref:glycine zipper 2TM domain-containing protein n=1 Tax=unclassified Nitratiruptor TaxID=2624044 RepID=UPI0019156DAD|nr:MULTISPECIES: glycine zipper 2TM domain-containing protein [unclassified Nitratiruptor]BCD61173.1 outer membrane lipoprotein SlyB [Nitratiruptor sp. YY08-13]BCD65106.1 outer membrane lipoprotein SlyB [Nitratiruptor sp. YY08-26]